MSIRLSTDRRWVRFRPNDPKHNSRVVDETEPLIFLSPKSKHTIEELKRRDRQWVVDENKPTTSQKSFRPKWINPPFTLGLFQLYASLFWWSSPLPSLSPRTTTISLITANFSVNFPLLFLISIFVLISSFLSLCNASAFSIFPSLACKLNSS